MGIRITNNSKLKASTKLLSQISSYLFEQEYGELKSFTPSQIEIIKEAGRVLSKVIKENG